LQTIIYCYTTCSFDGEIKKYEVEISWRMQGRDEKRIQDPGEKIRRKEILGNLGVNESVNLKWIGYCAGLF